MMLLDLVGPNAQGLTGYEPFIERFFGDLCRALNAAGRAFAAGDVDRLLAAAGAATHLPKDIKSVSAHHEARESAHRIWVAAVCGSPRLWQNTRGRIAQAIDEAAEHLSRIDPTILYSSIDPALILRWIHPVVLDYHLIDRNSFDYRIDPGVLAGAGPEIRAALAEYPPIDYPLWNRSITQESAWLLRDEEAGPARYRNRLPGFIPNAPQKRLLDALEGAALRTGEWAAKADVEQRTLMREKKELQARGLVAHDRRLGFYRPDAPPPDLPS
jgi:hypothetical protein